MLNKRLDLLTICPESRCQSSFYVNTMAFRQKLLAEKQLIFFIDSLSVFYAIILNIFNTEELYENGKQTKQHAVSEWYKTNAVSIIVATVIITIS